MVVAAHYSSEQQEDLALYQAFCVEMLARKAMERDEPQPVSAAEDAEGGDNGEKGKNLPWFGRDTDAFLASDAEADTTRAAYTREEIAANGAYFLSSKQDEAGYSEAEKEQIRELQARDTEVRMHEQAHAAMLGRYGGPIKYDFQIGPDGRAYAVGGSIQVNAGEEQTPEATLMKAQLLERAALGAGDPSAADMAVAAHASQMARENMGAES